MTRSVGLLCLTACVAAGSISATAASAAESIPLQPSPNSTEIEPTLQIISFDHAVDLPSATTIRSAYGAPVLGYHFESDFAVGDYWLGTEQSLDDFLANMSEMTGTSPEVVGAFVRPDALARSSRSAGPGGQPPTLATGLPRYSAPAASPAPSFVEMSKEASDSVLPLSTRSTTDRWDPDTAEVRIEDQGDTVSITQKFYWTSLDPYATVYNMPDHWGMEFQVDFYSSHELRVLPVPPVGYGTRPICGEDDYKDWASASNREFNWYALVIDSTDNYVYPPGDIGLYGDYNDLFDACTRSTVAVGMAQPLAMPYSSYGSNEIAISMFPDRGQEETSVVGATVQVVERKPCEDHPDIALTDCMGVNEGAQWPGPGSNARPVLDHGRGWRAPDLCWASAGFGTRQDPYVYSCSGGV